MEQAEKLKKCVYFSAPCYANASDKLISKKIYPHGTEADLKCEDGYAVSGIINGKMPVCFNGTWKPEYARFPYCAENGKIAKTIKKFYDNIED